MRMLAFLLGLLALLWFAPMLVLPPLDYANLMAKVERVVSPVMASRITSSSPGVLAGLALLMLALKSGGKKSKSKDDD
jgi:hypothetical protein